MAKLTNNHQKLYFDTLCRTQKGESVLSLIHATYQAKKNVKDSSKVKQDIAKRLEYAYHLYKKDAGSYTGDPSQFESQYTIGHEVAIWKNSNLDLTDLAIQVAENHITIRDYFDIVFLNYFQPINNNVVHLLYHLLEYMLKNNLSSVSKNILGEIYMTVGKADDKGEVNGAYNMLIATNYFKPDEKGKELIYCANCTISELLNRCNTEYITKGYETAKIELKDEEDYINYLLSDYRYKESPNNVSPSNSTLLKGENILYYGVPGSGKSYTIKQQISNASGEIQRVVFHPDYTYSDFVGQIMPQLDKDNNINYEFVPGPFTSILKAAKNDTTNMHYLIIEELNRGNAPAIFGEIFQLLDRNENGESEYGINNFDIAKEVYNDKNKKVILPSNVTILATMNTSDQNIFSLDTAFQRRWNMKHIKNDVYKTEFSFNTIASTPITWSSFANTINVEVQEINSELASLEDKRLGAYFIKANEMQSNLFGEKVLKYLWDDVFKMDRDKVFKNEYKSLDKVLEDFNDTNDGLQTILRNSLYQKMLNDTKSIEDTSSEE